MTVDKTVLSVGCEQKLTYFDVDFQFIEEEIFNSFKPFNSIVEAVTAQIECISVFLMEALGSAK